MAEGVGVSDEQLDEWDEDTRASVLAFGSSRSNERVLALIGEVRASHAREAELDSFICDLSEAGDTPTWLRQAANDLISRRRAALTEPDDNQSTEETP